MRIPIIPRSRAGRGVYLVFVIISMLGTLASAWHQHADEKAFADHGAVADVLPVDSYIQHASRTRFNDTPYNEWKSAQLRFRTADGQALSISHGLGDAELETLRAGGTLHMQYLPEDPLRSPRLEGHQKKPWQTLVLTMFLALYAWLLITPERQASVGRARR